MPGIVAIVSLINRSLCEWWMMVFSFCLDGFLRLMWKFNGSLVLGSWKGLDLRLERWHIIINERKKWKEKLLMAD